MKEKIKWGRLQKICEGITGKPVSIVAQAGGAGVPPSVRGAVKIEATGIMVYLNLLMNKTAEDVIATLAHELAHNVFPEHGNDFVDQKKELEARIKKEYLNGRN